MIRRIILVGAATMAVWIATLPRPQLPPASME